MTDRETVTRLLARSYVRPPGRWWWWLVPLYLAEAVTVILLVIL